MARSPRWTMERRVALQIGALFFAIIISQAVIIANLVRQAAHLAEVAGRAAPAGEVQLLRARMAQMEQVDRARQTQLERVRESLAALETRADRLGLQVTSLNGRLRRAGEMARGTLRAPEVHVTDSLTIGRPGDGPLMILETTADEARILVRGRDGTDRVRMALSSGAVRIVADSGEQSRAELSVDGSRSSIRLVGPAGSRQWSSDPAAGEPADR